MLQSKWKEKFLSDPVVFPGTFTKEISRRRFSSTLCINIGKENQVPTWNIVDDALRRLYVAVVIEKK